MAITHTDEKNFDKEIETGITLVDFYADWCGPCQMLTPILEVLSEEQSKVKIVKINVDTDPAVAQKYGVMAMPTLLMFKDGEKVDQKVGLMNKADLETWFNAQ